MPTPSTPARRQEGGSAWHAPWTLTPRLLVQAHPNRAALAHLLAQQPQHLAAMLNFYCNQVVDGAILRALRAQHAWAEVNMADVRRDAHRLDRVGSLATELDRGTLTDLHEAIDVAILHLETHQTFLRTLKPALGSARGRARTRTAGASRNQVFCALVQQPYAWVDEALRHCSVEALKALVVDTRHCTSIAPGALRALFGGELELACQALCDGNVAHLDTLSVAVCELVAPHSFAPGISLARRSAFFTRSPGSHRFTAGQRERLLALRGDAPTATRPWPHPTGLASPAAAGS